MGACETIIVWEGLEDVRYTLKNAEGELSVKIVAPGALKENFLIDKDGSELEIVSDMPFLEWLAENYKNYGATVEFVTDRSSEGAQFVKGFGGIGALLRYKVNFEQLMSDDEDEFYSDSD